MRLLRLEFGDCAHQIVCLVSVLLFFIFENNLIDVQSTQIDREGIKRFFVLFTGV